MRHRMQKKRRQWLLRHRIARITPTFKSSALQAKEAVASYRLLLGHCTAHTSTNLDVQHGEGSLVFWPAAPPQPLPHRLLQPRCQLPVGALQAPAAPHLQGGWKEGESPRGETIREFREADNDMHLTGPNRPPARAARGRHSRPLPVARVTPTLFHSLFVPLT